MNQFARIIALLCLSAAPCAAFAQAAANYPTKLVRVVVPLAPGGPTDLFARMYAAFEEKKYKQPFIVDNKPGGGQIVGTDIVVKAPADGYTLLGASNNLTYESLVNKDTPFNSARDILPFGIFAGTGLFLGLHPSIPATNMVEFVAWMKANPGKLNIGTAGAPVAQFEGLRDRLGLNWVYVNYKGGAPAMAALLAGEVHMYTPDSNQGVEPMKAGKVRLLVYSDRTRHPAAPDVPTVAESGIGINDFRYVVWLGMYAVPGVPEDIVAKLNADVIEMSRDPESQKRYNAMGWVPMPLGVDAVRRDAASTNAQIADLLAKGLKLR